MHIETVDPGAGQQTLSDSRGKHTAPEAKGAISDGRRPLAVWISTFGGVGFAPLAPGTFGSAVAVVLFPAAASLGVAGFVVLIVVVTGLGIWASERSESFFGQVDDGRIVIDEVAGQWIALIPLLWVPGLEISYKLSGNPHQLVLVVTAFVLFRGFDIWKPGPVRWTERRFRGGFGVMADDLVAGVFAAAVLTLIAASGVGAASA